jgi:hypothetical protein
VTSWRSNSHGCRHGSCPWRVLGPVHVTPPRLPTLLQLWGVITHKRRTRDPRDIFGVRHAVFLVWEWRTGDHPCDTLTGYEGKVLPFFTKTYGASCTRSRRMIETSSSSEGCQTVCIISWPRFQYSRAGERGRIGVDTPARSRADPRSLTTLEGGSGHRNQSTEPLEPGGLPATELKLWKCGFLSGCWVI